jgi:hypothetical protein
MPALMKGFTVIVGVLLLGGCAAQSRYAWNKYDATLYEHYKNPAQTEAFTAALKEIVAESEAAGQVPPGIYAEYGYLLFEQGNSQMAVLYLEKEAALWPESRTFMTKIIANIHKVTKPKDDQAKPAPSASDARQLDAGRTEVSQ